MNHFATQLTCLCGHRLLIDDKHPDAYKLITAPDDEDAVEEMSDDPLQVRSRVLQLCAQSQTVLHCRACGRYHVGNGQGGFSPYVPQPHDINFQTPSGYSLKDPGLNRVQRVARQAMVGRLTDALKLMVMRCSSEHAMEIRYYYESVTTSTDDQLEAAVAEALRAHWPEASLQQHRLQCSSASDVVLHDGDVLIYRG